MGKRRKAVTWEHFVGTEPKEFNFVDNIVWLIVKVSVLIGKKY